VKHILEYRSFSLNEGGNAFDDVQSINQEEVEPIFSEFKNTLDQIFHGSEVELIGSWRQKPVSGDLDLLLYSDLSLEEIASQFEQAGIRARVMHGFNIVSVRFETTSGKPVQMDMFVRPIESDQDLIELFYKSPSDEPYSTKHRVFLIFSALDSMKFDEVERGGEISEYKGYMLRPDGLYEFTKQRKRSKFSIVDKSKVTGDIGEIAKILFGKRVPFNKWNTFLKTLNLLKQNTTLKMESILANYRQKLESEGLRVPNEI